MAQAIENVYVSRMFKKYLPAGCKNPAIRDRQVPVPELVALLICHDPGRRYRRDFVLRLMLNLAQCALSHRILLDLQPLGHKEQTGL